MTAPWGETTLPTIVQLDEIYNANEFGLFYRMQSNKSLHLRCEDCIGGEHSKIRLTGLEQMQIFLAKSSLSFYNILKRLKHLSAKTFFDNDLATLEKKIF